MENISWFNSSAQVDAALVWVAVVGAIVEVVVAVVAVINVHREFEKAFKDKLEKYIEIFACIAAVFFMAEAILGWRSSVLLGKSLEKLKTANLELYRQIMPRRLTGDQRAAFSKQLSGSPWVIGVVSEIMDGESSDFADDIDAALRDANWQTLRIRNCLLPWNGVFVAELAGPQLYAAQQMDATKRLMAALVGINVTNEERTIAESNRQTITPFFNSNALYLIIAHKPTITFDEKPLK
ncbi:MAG TPA: hypothetical protein VFC44_23650 [Candidatus Saccharimonadales bacterium]|nr:hypothetical protein [Candidatus Saccharimonadales bacterium]